MALVKCLQCECTSDFTFGSVVTFNNHKKSQRHLAWEAGCKSDKIEATRRDNEIFTLKLKLRDREDTIERLYSEKHEISKKNEEHKCEILKLYDIIDELLDKLKKPVVTSGRTQKAKTSRPKVV